VRIDPIQARAIRNVQDGKAIQLEVMQIPRRSDFVSKRDRESIEGKAFRLEWPRDRSDNLSHILCEVESRIQENE
jgi:hypothetical protein